MEGAISSSFESDVMGAARLMVRALSLGSAAHRVVVWAAREQPTASRRFASTESVWRDPRVLCLCASTGCMMLGHGVATPIVPMLSSSLGASASAVGLALSAFGASRLALNIPIGLAADRFGRKPVLVGGAVVSAIGMAGSGLATDMNWFTASRVVAGAGNAAYLGTAQVYLTDVADSSRRARFLGANHAALLMGVSLGPAVGGICAEYFGLRAPFVAVSALSLVSAATSAALLNEPPRCERRDNGKEDAASSWKSIVLDPRFASVGFAHFSTFALRQGGRNLILALLAAEAGYSPLDLGKLFGAMAMVDLIAVGPAATLSDAVKDRRFLAVPSLLGTAASVFFVGVLADPGNQALFLGGAAAWSCTTAILGPTLPAYASDIAHDDRRALSISLFRSCGDLGFVIAPAVLGTIIDLSGTRLASATLATVVALSAVSFARYGTPSKKHS